MPFVMHSKAKRDARADDLAKCRQVLETGYPCGLVEVGGAPGFWAAHPAAIPGRLDVLVGIRDADGHATGMRFSTETTGGDLAREVATRIAAKGANIAAGHFVDAVVAALLLADLGRVAGQLVARSRRLRLTGHREDGLDNKLYQAPEAELLAIRTGAPTRDLDALCALVRGQVAIGAEYPERFDPCDTGWLEAVERTLVDACDRTAHRFLASSKGPALAFLQDRIRAHRANETLRWLDDAGWDALDDPEDRAGLGAALDASPFHADLILGSFRGTRVDMVGDVARLATVGKVIPATPGRVARSFVESGVGGRLDLGYGKGWLHPAYRRGGLDDPEHANQPATRALALLSRLPASWCPDGPSQWDAFARLGKGLLHALWLQVDGEPLRTLLNVGGDWVRYERRLTKVSTSRTGLALGTLGVEHFVRSLVEQVVTPALALSAPDGVPPTSPDGASSLARSALFRNRSLPRILELCRRWHRDRHGMALAIDALDPGLVASMTWESVLPDDARGEIEVVCLRSALELREEGARHTNPDGSSGMSHCVGSFVGRCMSGEGRVLSLRVRGQSPPARLSTAYVSVSGGVPMIVEHRGAGNAAPPRACVPTLDRYVRDVSALDLPALPTRAIEPREAMVQSAGYDFRVPGNFEAVRDMWSPYLPHPLKEWSPARFRSESVGPCVVGNVTPAWRS